LLEGLDVTILKLSQVRDDNEKLRIDDGFFSKLAVFTQQRIEEIDHVRLGEACSVFRKGIFDIKADSYVERGVPFVRIGDLKGGLIDDSDLAYITEEAHARESNTALCFGDVILSKTAYPAAALVNVPRCNVSQDTIAVQFDDKWKKKLPGGFLVAYLNSRHGLALMERQFQGNVQAHLSLPDGRKLPVPLFGNIFQQSVHDTILSANDFLVESREAVAQAEQTLLRALGLENWQPPEPLTYTRRASEALDSGRIDSDFFAPARYEALAVLAAMPHKLLSERCDPIREMFDPNDPGEITHVRNFDLTDALKPSLDDSQEIVPVGEIGSMKKRMKPGDLAVSRLRSYLREIAVVRTSPEVPTVGSSEFIVLRPKAGVDSELLMVFLRSFPVQTILKYCQEGNQHPRFNEDNLLNIPVPDVLIENTGSITQSIRAAHAARQEAQSLLERAKRAVEIAIEEGEAAGMEFLKSAGT
jgi:hypothetical protein